MVFFTGDKAWERNNDFFVVTLNLTIYISKVLFL